MYISPLCRVSLSALPSTFGLPVFLNMMKGDCVPAVGPKALVQLCSEDTKGIPKGKRKCYLQRGCYLNCMYIMNITDLGSSTSNIPIAEQASHVIPSKNKKNLFLYHQKNMLHSHIFKSATLAPRSNLEA